MSLSNILVPNNYDLFAKTITADIVQPDIPYLSAYMGAFQDWTSGNDPNPPIVLADELGWVVNFSNGGITTTPSEPGITVSKSGKYYIEYNISYIDGGNSGTQTYTRQFNFNINGTTVLVVNNDITSLVTAGDCYSNSKVSGLFNLSAGDVITVTCKQTSADPEFTIGINGGITGSAQTTTCYFMYIAE